MLSYMELKFIPKISLDGRTTFNELKTGSNICLISARLPQSLEIWLT